MRRFVLCFAVMALLSTAVGLEGAELSGNVALTSDYVFRGISQAKEDPAIQGGFDLAAGKFYAGVWGSNVDFGSEAHVELDGYLGVLFEYDSGFSWDVGAISYLYPSEADLDFTEAYLGLGYKIFSVKYSYSDDFAGAGGSGTYVEAGVDLTLPGDFTLSAHAGQSTFDEKVGLADYIDYSLGIAKEVGGFELGLSAHDTDLDGEPLAEERVVFTISKSL